MRNFTISGHRRLGRRKEKLKKQRKSRLHTVEIEGAGPFTFKSLSKRQMERIHREEPGADQMVAALKRAIVEPKPHELMLRIGVNPDALAAVLDAILERSWPRAEVG